MKRLGIALLMFAVIYGISVGIGGVLYATDRIATGATHNDCEDFRAIIAEEQGIDEEDVPQSEIKARSIECLESHERTPEESFRTSFLIWGAWPALICPLVFLAWPLWARILHNQQLAEESEPKGGPAHESGA